MGKGAPRSPRLSRVGSLPESRDEHGVDLINVGLISRAGELLGQRSAQPTMICIMSSAAAVERAEPDRQAVGPASDLADLFVV